MSLDKKQLLIYVAAAAIRLFLFSVFPSLADLLVERVELSTPVTSFKRRKNMRDWNHTFQFADSSTEVQEGLFLYRHGVSPYDGGVYHQVGCRFSIHASVKANRHPRLLFSYHSSRSFRTRRAILCRLTYSTLHSI